MRPAMPAVVALAVTLGLAGCGPPPERVDTVALDDDVVTVASFDFPESRLLAEIYGQALEAAGFDVDLHLGAGPRELVQPALAGAWWSSCRSTPARPSSSSARAPGRRAIPPRPTPPSSACSVTSRWWPWPRPPLRTPTPSSSPARLADELGLATISDLRDVAGDLVFGGPPECPGRPFCLGGLQSSYGLWFEDFMPLDVGGPLTHQALADGHIDVALLLSTDPLLAAGGDLVVLADDRSLQPAENVTPLVRAEVVARGGDELVAASGRRVGPAHHRGPARPERGGPRRQAGGPGGGRLAAGPGAGVTVPGEIRSLPTRRPAIRPPRRRRRRGARGRGAPGAGAAHRRGPAPAPQPGEDRQVLGHRPHHPGGRDPGAGGVRRRPAGSSTRPTPVVLRAIAPLRTGWLTDRGPRRRPGWPPGGSSPAWRWGSSSAWWRSAAGGTCSPSSPASW